jgi:hypothetical protein
MFSCLRGTGGAPGGYGIGKGRLCVALLLAATSAFILVSLDAAAAAENGPEGAAAIRQSDIALQPAVRLKRQTAPGACSAKEGRDAGSHRPSQPLSLRRHNRTMAGDHHRQSLRMDEAMRLLRPRLLTAALLTVLPLAALLLTPAPVFAPMSAPRRGIYLSARPRCRRRNWASTAM